MDLEAYFKRVGYEGGREPTKGVLFSLHRAHALSIPFENLDIQLGRGICIEPLAVERKLVAHRRGGYCFEQNTLLQAVLVELGFLVTACEARVVLGASGVTPRNHMLLVVTLGSEAWLCDVGFGAAGPLSPVALDGTLATQLGYDYRVEREGDHYVLSRSTEGATTALYVFTNEPRYPIDFEMANWYTSTHPESRFVTTLTAQRITEGERRVLRNLALVIDRDGVEETCSVARSDLAAVLRSLFELDVLGDARFLAIDGPGASEHG